jgi:mono/diheme cytochrome c family protein
MMKPTGILLAVVLAAGTSGIRATNASAPAQTPPTGAAARGEYLVTAMGCGDCHTPWRFGPNGPEPDMERQLSGHPADLVVPPPPAPAGPWVGAVTGTFTAWAGPWGITYSQNLTPDPETGVAGTYTEEQFIMTIREGKKQGRGRALLPPMPWPAIRTLTDEDLKAIYAYLKTLKPIRNKVPDPVIADAG